MEQDDGWQIHKEPRNGTGKDDGSDDEWGCNGAVIIHMEGQCNL